MGKTQSKSGKVGGADAVDGGKAGRAGKREVEEVFVEKIAYKCGVSEAELEQKKEVNLCVYYVFSSLGLCGQMSSSFSFGVIFLKYPKIGICIENTFTYF